MKNQTKEMEVIPKDDPRHMCDPANALKPAAESETQRMFAMIERMATDPAVDPAKLREILSVKQSWEADEARKAFARDMAVFQSRCPIISKADKAYDKMYARIDRIHRETRDLRKECGFWFTWSKCEIVGDLAHMEGLLGHSGGHTVALKQVIPIPDNAKGMNSTQRAGSAMTYAKRYGECLALDIVTGEDDDGNAARPKPKGPSEIADLKSELYALLKKAIGGMPNVDQSNQWLWSKSILDGGNPNDALPNLSPERYRQVIAKVREVVG